MGSTDAASEKHLSKEDSAKWNADLSSEEIDDGGVPDEEAKEAPLVAEMRQRLSASGTDVQAVDDFTLRRFLRARAHDVDKSCKMYAEHLKWKAEFKPDGVIRAVQVESEMATGKAYIMKKAGQRPWMYLYFRYHFPKETDVLTTTRFAVYIIDKAIASFPDGVDKFGAVVDLDQAGYTNLDTRAILSIFDVLQAHYPERLYRIYVIHVPYICWGIWSIVKPAVDPRTRQKIVFVADNELEKVLAGSIPKGMIPTAYGGTATLVPLLEQEKAESQGTTS